MFDLIVIGCSWGGLYAAGRVLDGLGDIPVAVAIAQHRSPEAGALASMLQLHTPLPVGEAEDKMPLEPGRVYLAPPDYHLLVERGSFALSTDERVLFARPSIDVLFESAADAYGAGVIGVVLTGANQDGANGLLRIRTRGGRTVVQDPATAERPEMPAAAIAAGAAETVLQLDEIGRHLAASVGERPRSTA